MVNPGGRLGRPGGDGKGASARSPHGRETEDPVWAPVSVIYWNPLSPEAPFPEVAAEKFCPAPLVMPSWHASLEKPGAAGPDRKPGFLGLTLIVPFLFCLGCGEHLVLESGDGAFRLGYDCAAFQPVAKSTSEYSVIRDYAVRAVRYAAGPGDIDAVKSMMSADADGRVEDLERHLVEYLCAGGGLSDEVPAPKGNPSRWAETLPLEKAWEIGSRAPRFGLPVLNSGFFSRDLDSLGLDDYRGQYLLLTFWATWCSPCIGEQMDLVPIWGRFKDRGFSVLGVLHKDEPERAWAWIQQNVPNTFPTVVDDRGSLAQEYGIRGIPRTFLIGPEGDIVQVLWGLTGTRSDQMLQALEHLLPDGAGGAP